MKSTINTKSLNKICSIETKIPIYETIKYEVIQML